MVDFRKAFESDRPRRGKPNFKFFPPHFTVEPYDEEEENAGLTAIAQPTGIGRDMLSEDQAKVFDSVLSWFGDVNARQYLTVGGLAGTGKSTTVAALAAKLQSLGYSVAFAAYTGKAASVLKQKLSKLGISPAFCGTLHSLMYQPDIDEETGKVKGWIKKERLGPAPNFKNLDIDNEEELYKLIVVDEASMVGEDMWNDLVSYDVPILAVGDHGQLPPVSKSNVNLMAKPDLKLERIHRQAAGNPILALAHHVRTGGHPRGFQSSDDRVSYARSFPEVVHLFNDGSLDKAVLCFSNKMRIQLNAIVRASRGFQGPAPDPSDVVICLRNAKPIFNGMRGVYESGVLELDQFDRMPAVIGFPDDKLRIRGKVCFHQFGREKTFDSTLDIPVSQGKEKPEGWRDAGLLFDFGYAMTCHKAQGSQFQTAIVMTQAFFREEDTRRRWYYTAVTRAAERLIVI